MVTTRPPKTIVKPTALGPIANTDTKLLIYGLFQKGRVLAQDEVVLLRIRPRVPQIALSMSVHLAWNPCSGSPEYVFTMLWNRCSPSNGMGVDLIFTMVSTTYRHTIAGM